MSRSPSRVPARRPSVRRRWRTFVVALTVALVAAMLGGCATFQDNGPRQWRDKPQDGGPLVAPPRVPDQPPDSGQPDQPPNQPGGPDAQKPTGCTDPDPLVIATCLDPVSAIAVLPDGQSALVAERATGQILRVEKGKPPQPVATVPVDASGGGLIGLVLSPSFDEDQLLYAYAATATDHRVVRVTPDGTTVPVLVGIPRTVGNDGGAMGVGKDGALLVATGADSANPGPTSLAGKVLRIDTFGHPFTGNPNPGSPIYSSGLHSPGGLCTSPDNGVVWATDRLAQQDELFKVTPGPLGDPAWNWPDRPGVAGCVAIAGNVAVAQRNASSLFVLQTDAQAAAFTGTPTTSLVGKYGRLSAAAIGPGALVWLGTANKGAGGPVVSSDDRVIRLPLIPGGSNGSGPD